MSLSPAEEQEFKGVSQLEVTYVDPITGDVRRRPVFCDPRGGKNWMFKARFLVSANLINLLSDTQATRHARFKAAHDKLIEARLNNLVDLHRLRQNLERLASLVRRQARVSMQSEGGLDLESEAGVSSAGNIEIGPVHFYLADNYLDKWSLEHLAKALQRAQTDLQRECRQLAHRIKLIGGGTWRTLLDMVLDKGDKSLADLIKYVLKDVTDVEERFEIDNKVSGGVRELYDKLQPKLQELEAQFTQYEEEGHDLYGAQRRLDISMDKLEERRRGMLAYLNEPMPKDEDDDASLQDLEKLTDAQAKVMERRRKDLFQEWEENKLVAEGRLQGVQDALAQMEERLREEALLEEKSKEGPTQTDLERKIKVLEIRLQRLYDKQDAIAEERAAVQAKLDAVLEACRLIEEYLASLERPIDPKALQLVKMRRRLRNLKKRAEKIRAATIGPYLKVRAIKYQLRKMYEKLGWEWDGSDDDEDAANKPYWKRRQLAAGGLAPFDPALFLNNEESIIVRRRDSRNNAFDVARQATMLGQLEARKKLAADAAEEVQMERRSLRMSYMPSDASMMGPSMIHQMSKLELSPFAEEDEEDDDDQDPVVRALTSMRRVMSLPRDEPRLSTAYINEPPRTMSMQLRADLQMTLQQCIAVITDLLPPDAKFGGHRLQLARMLEDMEALPKDPIAQEEREICSKLVDISTDLRTLFRLLSTAADESPSAALPPCREVDDLRQMLDWAHGDEQDLQLELRLSSTRHDEERLPHFFEAAPAPPCAESPPGSASAARRAKLQPLRSPLHSSEQSLEPLLRGAGLRRVRRRRRAGDKEGTDFGFRPDGGGEESLEKWSLFKVSKNRSPTRDGLGTAAATRLDRDAAGRHKEDPKAARYRQLSTHCDFADYVSGLGSKDGWHSASLTQLHAPKARKAADKVGAAPIRCPSLPQLVRAENNKGGSQVSPAARIKGLTASRSRTSLGIDSA